MSKRRIQVVSGQAEIPQARVQIPLPLVQELWSIREGFFALCIEAGQQVLEAMMEQDRTALCGPKWSRKPDRKAVRGGNAPSEVTLGGRRIPIRRPRVRSREDREVELPSFAFASGRDALDERTLETMALGVSARHYGRSLEPLPEGLEERSVSKSAVSRRFVALTQKRLAAWLHRPLGALELRVIVLDGIVFQDHTIVVALGVSDDGTKHVLGIREGSTENATVARALLSDLIERGLPEDRVFLFVIDGSKALHTAIEKVFGDRALIQRCQVHKKRNVRDHLPMELHASVKRAMTEAYQSTDAALAKRQLERLARSLEADHPGAAASLREGLDETLTLQRLGLSGALYLTLRSTNSIENVNRLITEFTRRVSRWRGGRMILRWVATAAVEAEKNFRRLQGYRSMPRLIAALERTKKNLDNEQEVA
jgi:transposase-like protein